jgi:hypothetical protein
MLSRPVSNADKLSFTRASLTQPLELPKKHEEVLSSLNPAHQEALDFIGSLKENGARNTIKLHILGDRPASEELEDLASSSTNPIHSSYHVALKTCDTKAVSTDHNHYNPRLVNQKLCTLKKTLKHVRSIQNQLISSLTDTQDTVSTIIEENSSNKALCKHFQKVTHSRKASHSKTS